MQNNYPPKIERKMKKITLLLFALVCAMTTWASEIDTTAVDAIYGDKARAVVGPWAHVWH